MNTLSVNRWWGEHAGRSVLRFGLDMAHMHSCRLDSEELTGCVRRGSCGAEAPAR